MKDFLYWIVYRLADIHTWIMQLNDGFERALPTKRSTLLSSVWRVWRFFS